MIKKIIFVFLVLIIYTSSYAQTQNQSQMSINALAGASAISVTIGGDFIITGTYPALVTERVDQFVTRMYNEAREKAVRNITDPTLLEKINKSIQQYSLRDITLKRADGTVKKIDLLKFRITGNFSNDPYLKNDDVLIFAPVDLKRDFFSISGAVNKPGKFMFVEGDKLSDAIMLAQGIDKAYENVKNAVINRLSYNGNTLSSDTVKITDNVPLKRGDQIVVLAKETQRKEFSVLVAGEVNEPGNIPITKNNTTLSEVIKRAGGFTNNASLKRARLYTGNAVTLLLQKEYGINLKNQQDILDTRLDNLLVNMEEMMMYRMSNIVPEDTTYFFLENRLRILTEGSSVDFTNIDEDSSAAHKYLVKNGDVIIIPPKAKSVYVFGQVADPGHIPFVNGEDYKYYIRKAGGIGDYADSDIMLIKAKSRAWIHVDDDGAKVEDGDYIYVPKSPVRSFHYYVREIGTYFGIFSSLATMLYLVIQISKK